MKKILLALMILACASASALAETSIQWDTYWGAYTSDATPPLTSLTQDFLLDSYSITWQLIYSTDSTAGAPDLANSANGWVSGNDEVWATRTAAQSVGGADVTASDTTVWGNDLYWVSGDRMYEDAAWTDPGYIFQRIYQGAPEALSYFYDSAPAALTLAAEVQTDYLDLVGAGTAGIQPNQQIPEPATMSLLGLGALVMAFRRRRS